MLNRSNLTTLLLSLALSCSIFAMELEQAAAPALQQKQTPFNWTGLPFDLRTRIMKYVFASLYRILTTNDKIVHIWDPVTGHEVAQFRGHTCVHALAPFAQHRMILGSGDHTVRIWDIASESEINSLEIPDVEVRSIAKSPKAETIFMGCNDGTIRTWNPTRNEEPFIMRGGHGATIHLLALTRKGTLISASHDKWLCIWNSKDGSLIKKMKTPYLIEAIDLMQDDTIIYGLENGTIYSLHHERDQPALLMVYEHNLDSLTVIPESRYIAAGLLNGTIHIFDSNTGNEIYLLNRHASWGKWAVFLASVEKNTLLSAEHESIYLWSLPSGKLLQRFYSFFINALTIVSAESSGYQPLLYDNTKTRQPGAKLLQKKTDQLKAYLMCYRMLEKGHSKKPFILETAEEIYYCQIVKEQHPNLFSNILPVLRKNQH